MVQRAKPIDLGPVVILQCISQWIENVMF